MSWDVMLVSVPDELVAKHEAPDWETVRPLGTRDEVLAALEKALPGADFSDPTWITVWTETVSMQVSVEEEDPIDNVMLMIRDGDEVLSMIQKLCETTAWKAWDTTTGDFIDWEADPGKGLQAWRGARDHVLEQLEREGETVLAPKRRQWWQYWRR